ncbi:MAG: CocE/NonD family hydrolase [Terriglobia bacterium]|jgi:putative CocE/NonD family hydrolase
MNRRVIYALLVTLSWVGALARAEEHYAVVVDRDVPAKMRDGVVLRADIYRPKAEGKFPVLLTRTPYDKRSEIDFGPMAAAHSYVVVVQDVRGRFASEGEWYTFKYESQDGYDTVEWAAALPYSNGKVGMYSGSYVGATQMLAAIASPPHLAAIFPQVTASNYHDGWTYQGGAFALWFGQSWTSGLAMNTLARRVGKDSKASLWDTGLPLSDYPLLSTGTSAGLANSYFDWLAHPDYDDYWKPISIDDHDANIRVPAYHQGGWYDIFLGGTLRNYMHIKARGGSDAARHGQRLLVGPWFHGPFNGKTGDIDFGPSARNGDREFNINELRIRWFDYVLKGVANGLEKEKPVKIFVMGRNAWRDEDDWPLARAKNTRYYLHSQGNANTLSGNGVLSTAAPAAEPADKYTYDPADPTPTRGGGLCCDNNHQPSGAFDQRPVEARDDVLVYSTPAFQEDFEVTGPITLELYASSSAVDTDFTGKLVDVWPNGYAQNLTDGILRARYRISPEKAEFMNPGEIYKLTLDLVATSSVFLKGHKLRVEISSSNFPHYDRNLNTGEDQGHSARMVKALNSVYHNGEHPSALILPVVPQ